MAETHRRVPASTRIHLPGLCPVESHKGSKPDAILDLLHMVRYSSNPKKSLKANFQWENSYHVIHFLLFTVSGVILSQCSHEDHGHQPHQEDDHHEGVEDWEPVNLKPMQGKQPITFFKYSRELQAQSELSFRSLPKGKAAKSALRDITTAVVLKPAKVPFNSPCAGRKMDPDICQIDPQTSHRTSSTLPAKSKKYMFTHDWGEHHSVTGTLLFRINCRATYLPVLTE